MVNCPETLILRFYFLIAWIIIPPGVFPDDYNKYEAPWTEGSPAHVYIRMYIMDVDKIDEEAMEFSVQTFFDEIWKETRLNLSSFTEAQDMYTIFPTYLAKLIWIPDIVFDNAKKGLVFPLSLPNRSLKVLNDGTFIRETRYNMIIGCQMDFRYYPMDTQECFMKIISLANHDGKVLLHWAEELLPHGTDSILLMNDIQPLKHILIEPKPYKSTEVWSYGNYTCLYANFTFVRRISGSILNVYVPSTFVVFLSWISFWLDVEAVPARVTLGVTSLLTLATQMVQARNNLPPISYMTAMDVWLFACTLTVFSSIVEFAFAYQLMSMSKQKNLQRQTLLELQKDNEFASESSNKVQSRENVESRDFLFINQSVRLRSSKPKIQQVLGSQQVTSQENGSATMKCYFNIAINRKSLDRKCRILFPLSFFVFFVTYWSYYLLVKQLK